MRFVANASTHQHVWSSRRYRALRPLVLERDGYLCRMPVCKFATRALLLDPPAWHHPAAPSVDHIRSLAEGGDPYDPANLRAAHWRCNTSAGAVSGNRARNRVHSGVTVSAPRVRPV